MSGFIAAGTPIQTRPAFNSGFLDFGTQRLVEVDNLSVTEEGKIVDMYVLGSIIAQQKARGELKFSLTGTIKSFSPEMESQFWGQASSGTNPSTQYPLDGQPTLINPVLTWFDMNGNEVQWQFIGAIFKSNKASLKMGDYATWEFSLESKTIVEVYS